MIEIIIRAVFPLVLLMGLGFAARHLNLLEEKDSKTLSSYVYYFALPALFIVNIAETEFSAETLEFVVASVVPLLAVVLIYTLVSIIFKIKNQAFYLFVLATVFGSSAFFGIPFITFTFPGIIGEKLAVLSAASISLIGVGISIIILETQKYEKYPWNKALEKVGANFSRNPLILSVLLGIILSLSNTPVPEFLSTTLHMLGRTTSTVAIFMLGLFLYGREYEKIRNGFGLSLLRIIFLPALAYLIFDLFFNLSDMGMKILVLMHAMPVAISMMVLSERYGFQEENIASLLLVSSVTSIIYLPFWLFVLGVS